MDSVLQLQQNPVHLKKMASALILVETEQTQDGW